MDKTKVEKRKEKSLCLRRSSGNLWGAGGLHPPRVVAHASLPPPTFARLPLPAPIHWLLKYFPIHCNTSTRSASPLLIPLFKLTFQPLDVYAFMIYWPVQPPGGVDPNAHQRSEQVPQGQFPIQHLQLYASRYPTISNKLCNDSGFGGKLFYKSFLL